MLENRHADTPDGPPGEGVESPGPMTEQPGDVIGRYRLRKKIGEGGCGGVYAADQETPVRRRVALKVIKLGMDTREVVARFEAERQALAMMDHPNIARVLDAGATQTGRPYFVMELVAGVRITEYCDQNNLGLPERLDLFIQVCHAVQHAHQKGVIHRDIKPSNVLVSLRDNGHVPQIIDFGIAKATETPLTDLTVNTGLHQFLGTPAYMSPEQTGIGGLDIDTRADIYSLGVLLYELLTGRPPFEPGELLAAGLAEMRRTISEKEPARPSTRFRELPNAERAVTARHRNTDSPKLCRLLTGDLDWIVMKALEKDRTRRYETANAFAADIKHFLADEPVTATAPSAAYRFHKFARRNKTALGVTLAVGVILVLACVISLSQAVRATRERDAKDKALREAESLSMFLGDVFRSPDPSRDGRTITVAENLDRAAKKLESDPQMPPALRASLQAALGSTYRKLGLYREAIPLQEKALVGLRSSMGPEHPDTLLLMQQLSFSYRDGVRFDEAIATQLLVRDGFSHVLGATHPETIRALMHLANLYKSADRDQESLNMREELLALSRKVNGPRHPLTLSSLYNLIKFCRESGRDAQMLRLLDETEPLLRDLLAAPSVATLPEILNLVSSYSHRNHPEALKMMRAVLALHRKILGPEHPETLYAMRSLGGLCLDGNGGDEGLALLEAAQGLHIKVFGPDHPETLSAMLQLGDYYGRLGRVDQAIAQLENVFRLEQKTRPPGHPETIYGLNLLASAWLKKGRPEEAIRVYEEALKLLRKVHPLAHTDILAALHNLADSCEKAGRTADAATFRHELQILAPNPSQR